METESQREKGTDILALLDAQMQFLTEAHSSQQSIGSDVNVAFFCCCCCCLFSHLVFHPKKSIFIFRLNAFCLQKRAGYSSRLSYHTPYNLCWALLCATKVSINIHKHVLIVHRKRTHTAEGAP